MSLTLEYDEVIETNGIKVPFVPRIITPKIERPMRAFQHSYNTLMNDEKLRQIHGDYCLAHETRIAELRTDPVLQ